MVIIAMVTKVSARNHGGEVRLKAAASFAESGDIHDVVEELWKGAGAKKQTLIDTVRQSQSKESLFVLIDTDNDRKSICFSNGLIKFPWSLMISYRIPRPLLRCRFCITAW
jgi:hypothetical protein